MNESLPAALPILLVDDDEDILFLLSRLLTQSLPGVAVEKCTNPEQALRYLANHTVSAIVTDNRMPVMDGLTFVRQLRERDPVTPVLMVTSSTHLAKYAADAGVTQYLPCQQLSEVAEALKKLLARPA